MYLVYVEEYNIWFFFLLSLEYYYGISKNLV